MDFWDEVVGHRVGVQMLLLLASFIVCSSIGLERQARRKSAGYRTHVLVGMGSCVFTLISAYGFAAIVDPEVSRDPTRIAAQVVSGIGFLGAGVIFKGSSTVRGLTTAGSIWFSAAVGMACGAGMVAVALAATVAYHLILFLIAPLIRHLPVERRNRDMNVVYEDGTGAMRGILETATMSGFSTVFEDSVKSKDADGTSLVTVSLRFLGAHAPENMVPELLELPGVRSVKLAHSKDPYTSDDEDEDED
jgi:putative Mg2+ transporter-C (MgtC) family protein